MTNRQTCDNGSIPLAHRPAPRERPPEPGAARSPTDEMYVQTFATPADAATDTQLESSSEHIDGLGDDAFWNATLGMVFVRNGDRAFAVTSPSLANLSADPQATNPVMVGLAKIVLRNS